MSRDWQMYLEDIVVCSDKIIHYTATMTQEQFLEDEKTYDAVIGTLR